MKTINKVAAGLAAAVACATLSTGPAFAADEPIIVVGQVCEGRITDENRALGCMETGQFGSIHRHGELILLNTGTSVVNIYSSNPDQPPRVNVLPGEMRKVAVWPRDRIGVGAPGAKITNPKSVKIEVRSFV